MFFHNNCFWLPLQKCEGFLCLKINLFLFNHLADFHSKTSIEAR